LRALGKTAHLNERLKSFVRGTTIGGGIDLTTLVRIEFGTDEDEFFKPSGLLSSVC